MSVKLLEMTNKETYRSGGADARTYVYLHAAYDYTLVWNFSTVQPFNSSTFFYTHDGNKNVSEVIASNNDVAAHYEYAPFGALTVSRGVSAADNPWRFSSEYAEDDTATVCYNYRHYELVTGRWMQRDPIEEDGGLNLFIYIQNASVLHSDELGMGWTWKYGIPVFVYDQCCDGKNYDPEKQCCIDNRLYSRDEIETGVSYYCHRTRWYYPLVQPLVRPFSPSQFMVDHCWFNVDGFRFGAYPNERFEDGKSIRDESTMPSNYNADHENSFWTSGGPVKLSPCEYDVEKFKKCIRGKFDDTSFKWMLWNNCRDFVVDSVRECKKLSKR